MVKNVRQRSFKIGADFYGIPFLRFGGKYLSRELGLHYGDRVELINTDGQIILRKFSPTELAEFETTKKEKSIKKMMLKLT